MLEISPVIVIGTMLSVVVNLVFFEKKSSFDVYYTSTRYGEVSQGRISFTVNSDYISAKDVEEYILEELDIDKNPQESDQSLKVIVTGQFKTGVQWKLKGWIYGR